MRRVTYRTYSHGVLGEPKDASLEEFLQWLPYLLMPAAAIPPLFILNEILAKGVLDAGMSGGCEWEPFQINQAEWQDLAATLTAGGMFVVDPAPWVQTYADWSLWRLADKFGIQPREQLELKALADEERRWLNESEMVRRQDPDQALEYLAKASEVSRRAADIIERYRPKDNSR
jgi:hypothetical protein